MNIGTELAPMEEKKVARMRRVVKPILDDYASAVLGILDKKRYQRFATIPWDMEASKRVRALLKSDASWRAVTTKLYPRLRVAVHSQLRSALQAGALDVVDVFTATLEDSGAFVQWRLPRTTLSEIGGILVGGYTTREHAKSLWDALTSTTEAAFRREVRRAKSMGTLRPSLKRAMETATATALDSFASVGGDAYSDGARAALALAEAPRLKVRTRE